MSSLPGGVSGVLFSGEVVVSTRLMQGCRPAGLRHTITECQRNVIVTWMVVPRSTCCPRMSTRSRADAAAARRAHLRRLPGRRLDRDDYLVRNLVGVDPESKLVAIGESLREGMPMMFCRRDAASAVEDMVQMLESIKEGLFTRPRVPSTIRASAAARACSDRIPASSRSSVRAWAIAARGVLLQRRDFPRSALRLYRVPHLFL
ncbi:MAG: FIST C-terminal domain-containing protein [Burkholderiales bacterium]